MRKSIIFITCLPEWDTFLVISILITCWMQWIVSLLFGRDIVFITDCSLYNRLWCSLGRGVCLQSCHLGEVLLLICGRLMVTKHSTLILTLGISLFLFRLMAVLRSSFFWVLNLWFVLRWFLWYCYRRCKILSSERDRTTAPIEFCGPPQVLQLTLKDDPPIYCGDFCHVQSSSSRWWI